jgi:hypothetical protein
VVVVSSLAACIRSLAIIGLFHPGGKLSFVELVVLMMSR